MRGGPECVHLPDVRLCTWDTCAETRKCKKKKKAGGHTHVRLAHVGLLGRVCVCRRNFFFSRGELRTAAGGEDFASVLSCLRFQLRFQLPSIT